MVKVRQDAWSHEDDLLLAETVLRHIREGSTQLNAFEEVGDKLNRTSAACGFRWNAEVRQKYDQAVSIAKRQRKEKKRAEAKEKKSIPQRQSVPPTFHTPAYESENDEIDLNRVTVEAYREPVASEPVASTPSLDLDTVIQYLRNMKHDVQESSRSKNSLEKVEQEKQTLLNEKGELERKVNLLQNQLATIQEDYQVLIQIMDRARKMVVFDEKDDIPSPAFRMEKNGNLEQVAR
ncbi:RsfA family transcriptional regulator [Radiobacillus kanasensis]|uniref:RsfA family transcriptional regulator n=1 Tax=Radiobacillus kanasensis TaxID=2844358 RepID=UPI001E38540C|nr:RsfA family transcriptional regulator [Radiobacillus kanasensis]UFT97878.1 RsfA family transcriptional regulator [Radiobacillus kanasensis]